MMTTTATIDSKTETLEGLEMKFRDTYNTKGAAAVSALIGELCEYDATAETDTCGMITRIFGAYHKSVTENGNPELCIGIDTYRESEVLALCAGLRFWGVTRFVYYSDCAPLKQLATLCDNGWRIAGTKACTIGDEEKAGLLLIASEEGGRA